MLDRSSSLGNDSDTGGVVRSVLATRALTSLSPAARACAVTEPTSEMVATYADGMTVVSGHFAVARSTAAICNPWLGRRSATPREQRLATLG